MFDCIKGIDIVAPDNSAAGSGLAQSNRHAARRIGIVKRINSLGTIKRIETGTANQGILAQSTGEQIVSASAQNEIISDLTGERVIPESAINRIVTITTGQNIIVDARNQLIRKRRAGCIGDTAQQIAIGIPTGADACGKVEDDRCRRIGIIDGVGAATAIKRIATGA